MKDLIKQYRELLTQTSVPDIRIAEFIEFVQELDSKGHEILIAGDSRNDCYTLWNYYLFVKMEDGRWKKVRTSYGYEPYELSCIPCDYDEILDDLGIEYEEDTYSDVDEYVSDDEVVTLLDRERTVENAILVCYWNAYRDSYNHLPSYWLNMMEKIWRRFSSEKPNCLTTVIEHLVRLYKETGLTGDDPVGRLIDQDEWF